MPYCVLADLKSELSEIELIELTDDNNLGIIDQTNINGAIAKADATIDSYCSKVESVPFSTVPPLVKEWSKTLAVYELHRRKKIIPEAIKLAYDAVISHLKAVARGEAGIPQTGVETPEDQIKSSSSSDDKKMTMGKTSDDSTGTLDGY